MCTHVDCYETSDSCIHVAPSLVRAGRVHVLYRPLSGVEVEFKWDEPSERHGVLKKYKLWLASVVDSGQGNSEPMTLWNLRLLSPDSRSFRLHGLLRGFLYYFKVLLFMVFMLVFYWARA